LPAPEPISGGIDFGEFIHDFIPGREGVVLPFTGTPLLGFDVEPSTITDFRGRVALAYLLGTAQTTDGPQDLEVDVRVMHGRYVADNGERRFGAFAEFAFEARGNSRPDAFCRARLREKRRLPRLDGRDVWSFNRLWRGQRSDGP
jgi:hypothetical protein